MALSLGAWALILGQLLLAVLCGGLIGYQRERLERPAGLRTHVLVCVGSAVYMLVSIAVAGAQFDPSRIAAQVASGMGFLGAGTIVKQGSVVRGLTTAASLWAVAGIGLAIGLGGAGLGIAVLSTLVVYLTLTGLSLFERRITRGHTCVVTLRLADPRNRVDWLHSQFGDNGIELTGISVTAEADGAGEVIVECRVADLDDLQRSIAALTKAHDVTSVHWYCR
jgi:putative Mg2+ transporter-C (MgtC) family protein